MPRPRRADLDPALPTRTRVLGVALELFRERGYPTTSLREIADRLAITKAALYYYFPAKTDLLEALADPLLDHFDAVIAAGQARDRSIASRRATVEACVDLSADLRAIFAWVTRDFGALAHPAVGGRVLAQQAALGALFAADPEDPIERLRAACSIGALLFSAMLLPDAPSPAERTAVVDAALAALGIVDAPRCTKPRGHRAGGTGRRRRSP